MVKIGCQSSVSTLQEPCVHHTEDLGAQVELRPHAIFKLKSSDEKLKYEWSLDNERIEEERYKLRELGVLSIQHFEKSYEGTYKCVLLSCYNPVMSVSIEMQLHLRGKEQHHTDYVCS